MTRALPLPSFFQITVSVVLGLVAVWAVGFFVFFGMIAMQAPETTDTPTDLAVVLTGGTGRVEAGFDILADGRAKALLISGVHKDATLRDLLDHWQTDPARKRIIAAHCCVTLGRLADDTESNATETAAYVAGKDIHTIRIVTSNYHMPRAWILFSRALPEAELSVWPVASNGPASAVFWRNVFVEYSKSLLTWIT